MKFLINILKTNMKQYDAVSPELPQNLVTIAVAILELYKIIKY